MIRGYLSSFLVIRVSQFIHCVLINFILFINSTPSKRQQKNMRNQNKLDIQLPVLYYLNKVNMFILQAKTELAFHSGYKKYTNCITKSLKTCYIYLMTTFFLNSKYLKYLKKKQPYCLSIQLIVKTIETLSLAIIITCVCEQRNT